MNYWVVIATITTAAKGVTSPQPLNPGRKRMTITRRTTLAGVAAVTGLALAASAAHAERHPRIHAAIRSLEDAKGDLEHADHDFGGHRVEAIRAINAALEQLREALRFDR
jgi:hypothetical protein